MDLALIEFKDVPKFRAEEYWIPFDNLQATITQLFAERFIRPESDRNRYVLRMGTGTGKTLTSLIIGKTFSNVYKNYYQNQMGDYHVIILGFSENIYKREFLKFSDLGFIGNNELEMIKELSTHLFSTDQILKEKAKERISSIKSIARHKIGDPNFGGFYKFYGYQQLFNHLFKGNFPKDTTSQNIYQKYKEGKISIDKSVLEVFCNSLLICDEIHQAYNSIEINNYGLAIQFILDYYQNDITAVLLSATIINNNKRELIDIANFIRTPGTPHFFSDDYFTTKKSLSPIYEQFEGKVIFLEEQTLDYPELVYMNLVPKGYVSEGNRIMKAYDSEKKGSFLQFTECPLTPLHEATYIANDFFNPEVKSKFNMINDLIVPNPDYPAEEILKYHPQHPDFKNRIPMVGLFDPSVIREKISNASDSWKKKIGISIHLEKDYHILSGTWLKYENLPIYSAKAVALIDNIRLELTKDPLVKILIYHPYVKDSGIITIAEILRQNGFINYGDQPKADTHSSLDFKIFSESKINYKPANIFTLSYEVKENLMNNMIDRYNSAENKFGSEIKIFLGSQKIKQSVDFKDVQVQFIYSAPTNIPELIQIKGRTVRNGSLMRLDPSKRQVRLYTLMSVSKLGPTFEVRKYMKKIVQFKDIQNIEYNINKSAVNNYIYGKSGFANSDPLGALPFPIKKNTLNVSLDKYFYKDFYVYSYRLISMMIKRAFMGNSVWTKKNLWEFISENPSTNIDMRGKIDSKKKDKIDFKKIAKGSDVNYKNTDSDVSYKNIDFGAKEYSINYKNVDSDARKYGVDFDTKECGVDFDATKYGINYKNIDFGAKELGVDFGAKEYDIYFGPKECGVDFGSFAKKHDDRLKNTEKDLKFINKKRNIYYDMFEYILHNVVFNPEQIINQTQSLSDFDVNNSLFRKYYGNHKQEVMIKKTIIYIDGYLILAPIDDNNNIDVSTNSFLRTKQNSYSRSYIISSGDNFKYITKFEKLARELENDEMRLKYLFLLEFDENGHYEILKSHIEKRIQIPELIFEIYMALELAGEDWYVDRDKTHIYNNGWEVHSRKIIPRKENDIVIGIIKSGNFKLRAAKDKTVNNDMRLAKKGPNCHTNKKEVLEEYYSKLNLIYSDEKVSTICDNLFIKLVDLEIMSIASENGLKYLYNYTES